MKRKYVAAGLFVAMLVVLLCPFAAFASYDVVVDNTPVAMATYVNGGGHLMAPVRPLAKAMDLTVDYDSVENVITINDPSIPHPNDFNNLTLNLKYQLFDVYLDLPEKEHSVKLRNLRMAIPCEKKDGSTYVPVRFLCDVFGAPLTLDGNTLYIGELYSSLKSKEALLAKYKENQQEQQVFEDTPFFTITFVVIIAVILFLITKLISLFMPASSVSRAGGQNAEDDSGYGEMPAYEPPVKLYEGETVYYDGRATLCVADRGVVEEVHSGWSMAMPDSDYLYHPTQETVTNHFGDIMHCFDGRMVITDERFIFLHYNAPVEISRGNIRTAELYRDGLALQIYGGTYTWKVKQIHDLADVMGQLFGNDSYYRNYAGSWKRLFPQSKGKVVWVADPNPYGGKGVRYPGKIRNVGMKDAPEMAEQAGKNVAENELL